LVPERLERGTGPVRAVNEMKSPRKWVVCSLLAIALCAARLDAAPRPRTNAPNVILITIDTLRADHLSCYGYHLLTTPRLDQFAHEGTRFSRAYTMIPMTGPAHVSLLTGHFPQEHGAKVNGQPKHNDPRLISLAQYLRARGYQTAAFVSAWPLKASLTGLAPGFQLYNEDFDRWYQMFNTYRSAEDVNPEAIAWMTQHRYGPFFLWVHYFDPHAPYVLHKNFTSLAANPSASDKPAKHSQEVADRIHRYDSEVAYTDDYVGQLLDTLDALGLKDSTIVTIVADHGESLGEHGYVGHGRQLYEPMTHVPLMMRYPPAVPAGRVVRTPVTTLDVLPTVLDLLKIKPAAPLSGKSLTAVFADPPDGNKPREVAAPPDPIFFVTFAGKKWEAPSWVSWLWYSDSRKRMPLKIGRISGDEKVIWTPDTGKIEVYNIAHDPQELEPLPASAADQGFRQEVNDIGKWFSATAVYLDNPPALDEKDREALRSLGYTAQ